MKHFLLYLLLLFVSVSEVKAEVDPNFYIFLCFGQSNMEGAAMPEPVDEEYVDERFQMLACDNFASLGREMGKWYTAYPPIVREGKGIGMADYFGRTMVANLPDNIKVGVVDVAVGGVSILAFMPESAADWAWIMNGTYDNDPYTRLVLMARIAQQSGVIKGILMHQGEADYVRETEDWPQLVNTVYENLLTDLGLNAADVPLLVGEMVSASEGGQCAGHNDVIATVPSVIPTAHVISSAGCEAQSDGMHFALPGYRLMGERYALEMLNLLGDSPHVDEITVTANDDSREYGDPNPAFGYTTEGGSINGIPDFYCDATELSTVGTYTIQITKGSITNENVTLVDGTLTVTPAPLTVTANSYTITQGDPLPQFEASYTGFKNNETSDVLTTQPTFTCDATSASEPGTYEIIVSGAEASNYSLTYTIGTLTISAPEIMRGDANGNRVIDMDDVVEIRNAIMGYPLSDHYNKKAADVNEDGYVNVADIVMLLKLYIIK